MDLTRSLTEWWLFEEETGTRTGEVAGSTLTQSAAIGRRVGHLGYAADLPGTASFSTADSAFAAGSGSWTWALWFQLDTLPAAAAVPPYYGDDVELLLDVADGAVRFQAGGATVTHPTAIGTGSKHLAVAWYDAAAETINLQVDGGSVVSAATVTDPADSSLPLYVGGYGPPGSAGNFGVDGWMDNLGRWARTLTSGERGALWYDGDGRAYPFPGLNLPFRHERLFRDLADLWRPVHGFAATDPAATTYLKMHARVRCLWDTKSAVDQPELIGLVEGEDMITVDTVRFPEGTDVDSSWIFLNKSINGRSGAQALNYGKGWIAKGSPVREESPDSFRTSGMVEAFTTKLVKLPTGVS